MAFQTHSYYLRVLGGGWYDKDQQQQIWPTRVWWRWRRKVVYKEEGALRKGVGDHQRKHYSNLNYFCNHCHCHSRNNKLKLLRLVPRIELLAQVHICFTYSFYKSSSIVVTLIKAQFFYPLSTNLLYWNCWTWIHLSLRNSAQIQSLQLALFVGRTCVLVSATVNMVGLGPQQENPRQINPQRTEPAGS